MHKRSPLEPLPPLSEINMTPLMDLTFILLITFIITFPLIEQGIPLDLPKGEASELTEDTSRTVSIDVNGTIYLDDKLVSSQTLSEEMSALGKASPDATVYLRSDKRVVYGKVVRVLKILHDANITRMALVTQPDPKENSR